MGTCQQNSRPCELADPERTGPLAFLHDNGESGCNRQMTATPANATNGSQNETKEAFEANLCAFL